MNNNENRSKNHEEVSIYVILKLTVPLKWITNPLFNLESTTAVMWMKGTILMKNLVYLPSTTRPLLLSKPITSYSN